jgi:dehydrogenase/reductase SDR family protein 12
MELWKTLRSFTRLGYEDSPGGLISADLKGKAAVVTGASTGIGFETAMSLARMGARVWMVSRDINRLEQAAEKIRSVTSWNSVYTFPADLSLLHEVQKLANSIAAAEDKIDILVNNAGYLFNSRQLTSEGIEKSHALLLLSPYYLSYRLKPLLTAAGSSRIINVSSGGMYTQKLRFDDLEYEKERYNGKKAYARNKRGLVMITQFLSSQWEGDGVLVNSMHPGWVDTQAVRDTMPWFFQITKSVLRNPQQGADTIVWLAAGKDAGHPGGRFWLDRQAVPMDLAAGTAWQEGQPGQLAGILMEKIRSILEPASRESVA